MSVKFLTQEIQRLSMLTIDATFLSGNVFTDGSLRKLAFETTEDQQVDKS